MGLQLGYIATKDVQFGHATEICEGILFINKEEMLQYLQDDRFASLNIELAKPGEETRIIPVKDVIEPRVKVEGPGGDVPWFYQQGGDGRHRSHPCAKRSCCCNRR